MDTDAFLQFAINTTAVLIAAGGVWFIYNYVRPWFLAQIKMLEAAHNREMLETLYFLAGKEVLNAEQTLTDSAEKLKTAIRGTSEKMREAGYEVSTKIVEDAVEAMVQELLKMGDVAQMYEQLRFTVQRNMNLQRENHELETARKETAARESRNDNR